MGTAGALTENMQNCLEMIYLLGKSRKYVRMRDIVGGLKTCKSGVTRTVQHLVRKGLVSHEKGEYVELTRAGTKAAQKVYRYHTVLTDLFCSVLDLLPERAGDNACRVEHVIGEEAFDRVVKFMSFLRTCPRAGSNWLERFANYCRSGKRDNNRCAQCLQECAADFQKSVEKDEDRGKQI